MAGHCMLLVSCSEGVTSILNWPSVQGAKSLLVIARAPGALPFGEAQELDPNAPIALELGEGFDRLELTALVYKFPLRSLGLVAGSLAFGDGRPLPNADAVFHTEITVEPGAVWESEASLPSELQQLRLASSLDEACNRWLRFTQQRLRIPGEASDGAVSIAVPLADGTALLGTRSGRLFRATTGAVTELPAPLQTQTATAPYLGGLRTRAGDVALIHGTQFLRGDPATGFTELSPFPRRASEYIWMSEISSEKFLALTDTGTVALFESDSWRELGEYFVHPIPDISGTGALATIGEGEAMIATPIWWRCPDPLTCPGQSNESTLERLRGGGLETIHDVHFNPTEVFHDEEHGTFIGSGKGDLVHWTGAGFDQVGADAHHNVVWAIRPANDGLFVATGRGEMATYHPALGLCPPQVYANGAIRHIVPVDGGYVVTSEPDLSGANGGGDQLIVLRAE